MALDFTPFNEILDHPKERYGGLSFSTDSPEVALADFSLSNIDFYQCELKNIQFERGAFNACFFKGLEFDQVDWREAYFVDSKSSLSFYENCSFKGVTFEKADFSGSVFCDCLFENVSFCASDFALCEFQECRFENCSFDDSSFNCSLFYKCSWLDPKVKKSTFKAIEEMDKEDYALLEAKGAIISYPFVLEFSELVDIFFFKILSGRARLLLVFVLGGMLGWFAPSIVREIKNLYSLDANPLSSVSFSMNESFRQSYFRGRLHLENFDFSEGFEHWAFYSEKPNEDLSPWVQNDIKSFSSFPQSLKIKDFDGKIFYSKKKRMGALIEPYKEKSLWMPVSSKGENLTFSFNFRFGHPDFRVVGRLKRGGHRVLLSVEARQDGANPHWQFFRESFKVGSQFDAIALELGSFPDREIWVDDVNIEKTV